MFSVSVFILSLVYVTEYLYHYTSKESAKSILKDARIMKSTNTNTDAILGEGVYFTDLDPSTDDTELLENNYGRASPSLEKKVEVCFKIPASDMPGYKRKRFGSRVIYAYPDDVNLEQVTFQLCKRGADGKWDLDWKVIALTGGAILLGGLVLAGLGMLLKSVLDSDEEEKNRRQKYKH